MDITNNILNTIKYYGMLEKGDKVLTAVSGGSDSVFLLCALRRLKDKLGLKLWVAHMDHGIRGEESRKDAEFVRKLARSLDLKFVHKKLKPDAKKTKISLEEHLRAARYDFFKKAAKKTGANIVATAHTMDDQAETVLMRIVKGASLKGVVGIHPVRLEKKVKFIRPLIEIRKKDILGFLKKERIPYRIDRTNLDDKFLRNRVRNKLLPYLRKINPQVERSLCNLADSLREDFDFIEKEKKKKRALIKKRKRTYYIALSDILLQPKAIRREMIRDAMGLTGANIKKLTFRHWKDIDLFLRTKRTGKALDLPGSVKIERRADCLIFSKLYDIIKG